MFRTGRVRLHPGWAWTTRYPRVIPTGYGAGSLFAGAALGALGSLLAAPWTWSLGGFTIGLAGASAIGFGGSEIARHGRDQMLERNGIAYIIRERARGWQRDEPAEFVDQARRRFVRVIEVPGPGQLGSSWDWPLDEDARQWDDRLGELARSFRTLYLATSTPGTPAALFIYAWWAVAVALGARLTAADRGLALAVGQRPSNARAGKIDPDLWVHPPQLFTDASGAGALSYPGSEELTHRVELAIAGRRTGAVRPDVRVSVLLLRFGRQGWDPLSAVGEETGDASVPLRVHDRARLGLSGTSHVLLHELRCLPPPGEQTFAWEDFPALAITAADWIERKAAVLAGHTLLLGAVMPQETALGLGICAGQVKRTRWPEHLWPLLYQKAEPYVIPRLDLGTARLEGRA